MFLECALLNLCLFFKNSPSFGYRMVTQEGLVMNINVERPVADQRKQYEKEMVQRYLDSYEDAVRLIIRMYIKEAYTLGLTHNELFALSMDAVIDGIVGYKAALHKDLDSAVYQSIHKAIGEKMRTKAMKSAA